MHVAVYGSSLIERPYSPSSLHLIEWLSTLHSAGAHVTLLYPQGELPPIPEQINTQAIPRKEGTWSRLRLEQRDLPRAAGELKADLMLVGEGRAPLASPCPMVIISSFGQSLQARAMPDALAVAAGRAGSRGASAILYPNDVGSQPGRTGYPPFAARAFKDEALEVREPYVLCYGYDRRDIPLILSAWTWVDGSLGDTYPLTFLGVDPIQNGEIDSLAADLNISASVRTQPEVSYSALPRLFGGAAASLGTAFSADGQALRWALTAGAPVVGLKTPEFEAVLGEAAYLVPPGDSRALGAACLTVLIQERVSGPLREMGRQRANKYMNARIGIGLIELLTEVANLGRGE